MNNPSGVWSFGYYECPSLDPSGFRLDEYSDQRVPISFWHPEVNTGPGPGYYPYIAFNRSNRTEYGSNNGWAARAGQTALEASAVGLYSVIRFVAPIRGDYKVTAQFEGIHFLLSTTDVHILHKNKLVFDAEIAGYGGDPTFHGISGPNPAVSYSKTFRLEGGDTVDFVVGYGANESHVGDTTGLFAEVILWPKTEKR